MNHELERNGRYLSLQNETTSSKRAGHYPQTLSFRNQIASWEKDWIELKRQALGAEAKVLIMVGPLQKEECGS